ncbi:MAG: PrgI family protein, partial [Patescibacteria group bacterium]|nr:PrgI family protein [Patescibacteria group bacterium]
QQKTISKDRMKDAIEDSNTDTKSPDYWFMDQPKSSDPNMAMFGTVKDRQTPKSAQLSQQFSRPARDDEETRILNELRAKNETSKNSFHNRKSISTNDNISTQKISIPPVTAAPDPVTIELAGNNDRVVSSLARESNKAHPELPDDEVIISLH